MSANERANERHEHRGSISFMTARFLSEKYGLAESSIRRWAAQEKFTSCKSEQGQALNVEEVLAYVQAKHNPLRRVAAEESRFWSKVDKNGPAPAHRPELGPCWLWTASLYTGGYGHFKSKGSPAAHRWIYTKTFGEISEGLQIDHLCRTRACVNPLHLEAVTPQVNTLRAECLPAFNAQKTHCHNGHEFNEANTLIAKRNRRQCRACHLVRQRDRKQRLRAIAVSQRAGGANNAMTPVRV